MKTLQLGSLQAGNGQPAFIIAEIGINHQGDVNIARKLVNMAKECGANAVKLQKRSLSRILTKEGLEMPYDNRNSFGKTYGEHKKVLELSNSDYQALNAYCRDLDIIFSASGWDEESIDFLNELDVPFFKMTSADLTNFPLLKHTAQKGKPMIISTGMANISELDEMVSTIRKGGCEQFVLLKCTSSYPAPPESSNLLTIPHMRELFNCEVGLSDHTMGIGTAVAAVAQGATVIEKHFTIRRSDGGVDSAFSMEPEEMKQLVIETKRAWQSLGKVFYGPTEVEKESKLYSRSLYIAKDMKKGDVLSPDNLRIIRPGQGLPPKYYDVIMGRRVTQDLNKGTAVNWNLVK